MKRRLSIMMIIILAVAALAASALAAPTHLPSITDHVKHPGRIAVDSQGNLYLSEPSGSMLQIFDNNGRFRTSLQVPGIFAVAVDKAGRIYVGSEKSGSVQVYNADLTPAFSLGSGKGEFKRPNDIAVDNNGRIYVVDSRKNVVQVYEPTGKFAFRFGGRGNTDGLFTTPTAVALNDATGEIYVADRQRLNDGASGARIQVFDKTGTFKRSFGQYGQAVGQMTSPVGITVDEKTGTLYVVDSFQNAVLIVDPATGVISDALYDLAKPLATPQGAALTRNGIVYVASYNGKSVEEYALDGYVTMDTAPSALGFSTAQYGPSPSAQTVTITNSGSGTTTWTASADASWIVLGQTGGTAGPAGSSSLPVGVNTAALAAGTYSGTVSVASDFGRTDKVAVNLTVLPPPSLVLSNGWLTMSAKTGAPAPAQNVTATVENAASLTWSATSDSPWLSIAPASGTTTAVTTVSANTTGLKPGSYTGYLTFSAPGAIGDGSKLTVTLTVASSTRITVASNVAGAKYTITGPASYTGSGANWSVDDAPLGDYTITYDSVAGYRRPLPQTGTLSADGDLAFTAAYVSFKDIAARTNIIAARTEGEKKGAVKAYKNDGSPAADLRSLRIRTGADVATGDIDGDGTAELIVVTGRAERKASLVSVYKADMTKLLDFSPSLRRRADDVKISAADFDGDGKAELIVAASGGHGSSTVTVYSYDKAANAMVPTGVEIATDSSGSGVNVAAGDTEGDQNPELIVSAGADGHYSAEVAVWRIDRSKGMGAWTASITNSIATRGRGLSAVAAGDTDGDGKDEIIVGPASGSERKSGHIRIFKADGTELKGIKTRGATKGVAELAAADLDGDGIAEIIAGVEKTQSEHGKDLKRDHEKTTEKCLIDVYSADGALKFSIAPFGNAEKDINVAVGEMGL